MRRLHRSLWLIALLAAIGADRSGVRVQAICVAAGPACEEYWRTPAVFLGKAISTRSYHSPDLTPVVEVTFDVTEAYKGVTTPRVVVRMAGLFGEAVYPFRSGADYLVFARPLAGMSLLTTDACTRTHEVKGEDPDLVFLRGVNTAPPWATIFGTITSRPQGSVNTPLERVPVHLHRPDGTISTMTTDAEGRYEFTELPAGEYYVSIDLPPGLQAPDRAATLEDRHCAQLDFFARAPER